MNDTYSQLSDLDKILEAARDEYSAEKERRDLQRAEEAQKQRDSITELHREIEAFLSTIIPKQLVKYAQLDHIQRKADIGSRCLSDTMKSGARIYLLIPGAFPLSLRIFRGTDMLIQHIAKRQGEEPSFSVSIRAEIRSTEMDDPPFYIHFLEDATFTTFLQALGFALERGRELLPSLENELARKIDLYDFEQAQLRSDISAAQDELARVLDHPSAQERTAAALEKIAHILSQHYGM